MAAGVEIPEKTFQAILQNVRNGLSLRSAFELNEHSGNIHAVWQAAADAETATKKTLSRLSALKKARRESENLSVSRIRAAGEKSWQADAWYLERCHGYVARTQLEHSGPDGEALKIIVERGER